MMRRTTIILSLGIHAALYGMVSGDIVETKVDPRPPIYLTLKGVDASPQSPQVHPSSRQVWFRTKTPADAESRQGARPHAAIAHRKPVGISDSLKEKSTDDENQGQIGEGVDSIGGTPAVSSPNPGEPITIQPHYPLISRRLGEEGVVLVKINCPDTSKCLYNIIQSSGHDRLDRSVRQSLSQLSLAQVDGRVIRFLFQLNH